MIKKLSSFIVLLVLISCGSATKENFNINIKKTKEYLKKMIRLNSQLITHRTKTLQILSLKLIII